MTETGRYDPFAALRTLQRHGVRFVVIGGVAGRLWGSPTMTNDLDICPARDRDNLKALAAALVELGARLRGVDEPMAFRPDPETLRRGQNFTFITTAGALDVLGMPAGVNGFRELVANAQEFDLGERLVVAVCSLDDLIRMKQAAGRPKDRIEAEVLAAVREEGPTRNRR